MGAEKVIKRYRKKAFLYEKKRKDTDKWKKENTGVEAMLPDGVSSVIDVPVGTGRFHYLYKQRGITALGVDSSPAMLAEAAKKGMTELAEGDIRNLHFVDDNSFDAAVCMRLFGWFEPNEVRSALKELARIATVLVIGIRTNEDQPICKNMSLWNHYHKDFLGWVEEIGYKVDADFQCGKKGNAVYRLIPCV